MTSRYPALEWLQRRVADSEPLESIAARAGVSVAAVRRATDPYLPPTAQAARDRRRAWIAMRRNGTPVHEIARQGGVTRQAVTRATAAHGPYPSPRAATPDQTRAWVTARRAGTPIPDIAAEYGVPPNRVRAATQPYGPFRPARTPLDNYYSRSDIASLLRITEVTISTWHQRGYLPPPDTTTPGPHPRPLWKPDTIHTWIPTAGLTECPHCGALLRKLKHHHAARHDKPGEVDPVRWTS